MPHRYQRGFVRLRGKQKTWYGLYREDYRKPDGSIGRTQRQVNLGTLVELPTKAAARRKLDEFVSMKAESPLVMDIVYQELADRWLAAEGPSKKPSTLIHYRNGLNMYILPTFANVKIATVGKERIQTFLAAQAHRYSHSALKTMRTVFSMTLRWAADCGWIPRNPCTGIALPKQAGGKRVKRTLLTPEQVNALAGNLEEPYSTLVLFLYVTGLRIGEALALRWADLVGNVITVTRRNYKGDVDTVKS